MNDTGSKMKYKTVFRLKDLLSSIIFAHDKKHDSKKFDSHYIAPKTKVK